MGRRLADRARRHRDHPATCCAPSSTPAATSAARTSATASSARASRIVGRIAGDARLAHPPALARRGGAARARRPRHRHRAQAAPAGVGARARHRPHRVDLRPARTPQRAAQPRQARRRRRGVPRRLLRRDGRRPQRRRRERPHPAAVGPRVVAGRGRARRDGLAASRATSWLAVGATERLVATDDGPAAARHGVAGDPRGRCPTTSSTSAAATSRWRRCGGCRCAAALEPVVRAGGRVVGLTTDGCYVVEVGS